MKTLEELKAIIMDMQLTPELQEVLSNTIQHCERAQKNLKILSETINADIDATKQGLHTIIEMLQQQGQ